MKHLVLVVTILMAAPAFAQTTTNRDKATAVAVSFTDAFFNDNDHFKLSGCELATWSAIHLAVIASMNNQDLREDKARGAKIKECHDTVWSKEELTYMALKDSIIRGSKDESLRLLEEEEDLRYIASWAAEAYEFYSKHCWLNR